MKKIRMTFSRTSTDILHETIGDFGRWQFKISILMALLKFPIAWFQLGIVFLAPPTQHWCRPPEKYANLSTSQWLTISQLNHSTNYTHASPSQTISYCSMPDFDSETKGSVSCKYGYNYNRSVVHSSLVTEWDLVCDDAKMVDVVQIVLMLGILIGNVLFGIAADKYGRKTILIICIFVQSVCSIASAFVPWFWSFLLLRFILAVANGGTMVSSFVMCMEVVGGFWRTVIPILYQIPFGIGNSIMAGLAFLLRDWREFQLAISVLSALFIFYIWLIPESPRWLFAVGQKDKALIVLKAAARTNKINTDEMHRRWEEFSSLSTATEKPRISTLFSTRTLRIRTLLLTTKWLISGITFYAFSQYLGQVSQNIYFTVAVGGLIAVPGTVLCVYIVAKSGRRWTITVANLLSAACFLSILAVKKGEYVYDWPRVVFAGVGIIGMSVSLPALYLFTGELYPTIVRNAGVGTAVMFSRVGSMLAPLVASLHYTSPLLPLLTLAVLAAVEALLVLPLPETRGSLLPEKLEDLNKTFMNGRDAENGNYIAVTTEIPQEEFRRQIDVY